MIWREKPGFRQVTKSKVQEQTRLYRCAFDSRVCFVFSVPSPQRKMVAFGDVGEPCMLQQHRVSTRPASHPVSCKRYQPQGAPAHQFYAPSGAIKSQNECVCVFLSESCFIRTCSRSYLRWVLVTKSKYVIGIGILRSYCPHSYPTRLIIFWWLIYVNRISLWTILMVYIYMSIG